MSFDLFAMQQQLLDRLTEAGITDPVGSTFDAVDITDDSTKTTGAQFVFLGLDPAGQVGRSAAHVVVWSFDLYVDTARASPAQKTAAANLFSAALAALIGWGISPGREVRSNEGQPSGMNGRVVRISFGFTVPVYLAG